MRWYCAPSVHVCFGLSFRWRIRDGEAAPVNPGARRVPPLGQRERGDGGGGPAGWGGKPVIRGTRVAVELVLELLAAGQTEREILERYPGLTREDVLACLAFAGALVREFRTFPIPA